MLSKSLIKDSQMGSVHLQGLYPISRLVKGVSAEAPPPDRELLLDQPALSIKLASPNNIISMVVL